MTQTATAKHTPGPWFVDDGCYDDRSNMIEQLRSKSVADEWVAVGLHDQDGYSESVAYCHPMNAALIAAAPDLRAACEAAVFALEGQGPVAAQCRAAISKAKGS